MWSSPYIMMTDPLNTSSNLLWDSSLALPQSPYTIEIVSTVVSKNSKIAKYDKIRDNSHLPGKFIIFRLKDPLAQKRSKSSSWCERHPRPDSTSIRHGRLTKLQLWGRQSQLGSDACHSSWSQPIFESFPRQFRLLFHGRGAAVRPRVAVLSCNKSGLVSDRS